MTRSVRPSVRETALSCPHCGAYTTQWWHSLHSAHIEGEKRRPYLPSKDEIAPLINAPQLEEETRKILRDHFRKLAMGTIFLGKSQGNCPWAVSNLFLSECYNCGKLAVWVHDRLVYPGKKNAVEPSPDLPDDIAADFEEARGIVGASPRGAAALLRLCIQKLCAHLGEKGNDINEDIGNLVKKGLDPVTQRSLDIVRVIGNEAVHGGVMDLRDDRETAERLFDLVNAVADQMISRPKKVQEIYDKLPEPKRKAIEERDRPPAGT
jgi:hypothetical protein